MWVVLDLVIFFPRRLHSCVDINKHLSCFVILLQDRENCMSAGVFFNIVPDQSVYSRQEQIQACVLLYIDLDNCNLYHNINCFDFPRSQKVFPSCVTWDTWSEMPGNKPGVFAFALQWVHVQGMKKDRNWTHSSKIWMHLCHNQMYALLVFYFFHFCFQYKRKYQALIEYPRIPCRGFI